MREGGNRVPAIAVMPGRIKAGVKNHDIVGGLDLMATFAAVAGVDLPTEDREGQPIIFDSYDTSPVLFGTGKSERDAWFYFTENELSPGAARVGNYKAVFNLRGGDGAHTGGLAVDSNLGWKGADKYVATVPQVFDLWADPRERYNIFMNNFTERTWTLVTINEENWLMRASLPVNSYPVAADGGLATGIGDLNVFAAYLFDTGNPAVSFGLGPQITAPTAPDERLGSEKWSAGLANVLFDGRSKRFQYGYLLTWQASFAGSDDRADVNVGALQPFAFYQLGKGLYLRSAPIWVYNFDNDAYSIPLGLGIGQVIKRGKTVFNVFVEPQASVAYRGPGQPDWQIFAGFNMQFLN